MFSKLCLARKLLVRAQRGGNRGPLMSAKETTTMAQIDQQAAREELKEASQLRTKAEQLIEIADELYQQADSHEQDALDLIAPAQPPSSGRRGH
jgi:endonuclease III